MDVEKPHHPWKARFIVGSIMLVFSFVGLVVTDIAQKGTWNYWRVMVPIFAILSLWLSHYLRKKNVSGSPVKLYHEVFHWIGLMIAVYLVSLYVHMGIMDRFEAGLVILTLLALTVFLAGIYIESSFLVIGIVLGLFAGGVAFFEEYLYSILLPIIFVGAGLIFYLAYRKRH